MSLTIGVFFGGRSTEHDVSIASAFAVMRYLSRVDGYSVLPIYVTREGTWVYDQRFLKLDTFTSGQIAPTDQTFTVDVSKPERLHCIQRAPGLFGQTDAPIIDVVFPVFHGLGGEDGSIQGLCEFLGVPYVGPSIFCNALGINKIAMKRYFEGMGLPITRYRAYHSSERATIMPDAVAEALTFPVFVKPARLGSTIGISMVK